MKRFIFAAVAVCLVVGYASLAIQTAVNTTENIELQEVQLKSNITELKDLQLRYDNLNVELDHTENKTEEQIKKLQTEKEELEAERIRLEAELLAKRERQQQADEASRVAINTGALTQTASAAPARAAPTGNKAAWLAASNIPESQWWAVDSIVSRESGWNPCAYNPGRSNCNLSAAQVNAFCTTTDRNGCAVACGLGQSLPCGKWGSNWTDPVAQLNAQYRYVNDRYGGYPQAVAFWNQNSWY